METGEHGVGCTMNEKEFRLTPVSTHLEFGMG